MSGTINIHPTIDTSDIDAALALFNQVETQQSELSGDFSTRGFKEIQREFRRGQTDLMGNMLELEKRKDVAEWEIKGLDTFMHRTMRMIPGVREVDRTYRNIKRFEAGYAPIALLNFALIAGRVIQMINSYLSQLERERMKMEVYLREARGITTKEGYQSWTSNQKMLVGTNKNIKN